MFVAVLTPDFTIRGQDSKAQLGHGTVKSERFRQRDAEEKNFAFHLKIYVFCIALPNIFSTFELRF